MEWQPISISQDVLYVTTTTIKGTNYFHIYLANAVNWPLQQQNANEQSTKWAFENLNKCRQQQQQLESEDAAPTLKICDSKWLKNAWQRFKISIKTLQIIKRNVKQ